MNHDVADINACGKIQIYTRQKGWIVSAVYARRREQDLLYRDMLR